MKTIWIICSGNTCRSPMGEALLKEQLKKTGKANEYEVKSGGLQAFTGDTANPMAVQAMREIGLDISDHTSNNVTALELENADMIFVMTLDHKAALQQYLPSLLWNKIIVMNIDDPYGLSLEAYTRCRDQMALLFKKIFGE